MGLEKWQVIPESQLKMHVLFVPSWYPRAEAPQSGVFFKEQVEGLHRTGLRVGVVVSESRSLRRWSIEGVARNHFQCSTVAENGVITVRRHGWALPLPRPRSWLRVKDTIRLIHRYVREHGMPDVMHVHSILHAGIAASRIKQQLNIPYVVTEHSTAFARGLIRHWEKEEIQRVIDDASAVMAVGQQLGAHLADQYGRSDVRVVPNYIDTDFFRPGSRQKESGPFRILSIGALTPKKGMEVLLRAFAEAFPSDDSVVLEIGGDGPDRLRLERQVSELSLAERVVFLGNLSREEVRGAMWRADAFALASFVETFGVVLIEALATGLPVVATRSGGPEDIVTPEIGILVERDDIPALARALEAIRRGKPHDPVAARRRVIEHFSEKAVTKTLRSEYDRAVGH